MFYIPVKYLHQLLLILELKELLKKLILFIVQNLAGFQIVSGKQENDLEIE